MNKLVKIVAPIVVVLSALGSLFMVAKVDGIKKKQAADIQELTGTLGSTKTKLETKEVEVKDLNANLLSTQNKLAEAEGALTSAKSEVAQKSKALEDLQATVAGKDKEITEAKAAVTAAQEENTQIKDKLAKYEAQSVDQLNATIKEQKEQLGNLANENKVLGQQLGTLKAENAKLLAEKEDLTTTPVTVRGAVSAIQDKWGFVVLNVGEADRVRKDSKFLVYRDSKLVCKVQVTTVYPNSAVAEVISDYQRGEPRVGDLVLR